MENNAADITEEKISRYLETVKIKHTLMGLDEKEVWILVSNIQKFYRQQLETEKEKSDAVVSAMQKEIAELKTLVEEYLKTSMSEKGNEEVGKEEGKQETYRYQYHRSHK